MSDKCDLLLISLPTEDVVNDSRDVVSAHFLPAEVPKLGLVYVWV